MTFSNEANQTSYPFSLPDLPYSDDSFGELLSKEAFDFHHKKHHNAYVANLNKLLENNSNLHGKSLEEIILTSAQDAVLAGIFNNAAQIWNHSFFWHSMQNGGASAPQGKLLEMINRDFGNLDNFKTEFKKIGAGQFGSGWVWLVLDCEHLKLIGSSNAQTPITSNLKPLLTCDVWEHAYYIDYRNRRPDYLSCFIEEFVNWNFAEKNLAEFI